MKAITTKFLPCTNTKGARIVARDGDGNRAVISYPDEARHDQKHWLAAKSLCQKMGWQGTLAQGWVKPGEEVFVFVREGETFKVE